MPLFSVEDYHKLLQKIAVLETKINRLEVNVEINGQYGNDTTVPVFQNSEREQANTKLTGTTKTRPEPGANGSKSNSAPWDSLGAKPKYHGIPPSDMGRRLSGRTQHPEIHYDTEWPALPSHRNVSSTPKPQRKQPRTKATTKTTSKLPQDTGILLENRFALLSQDPDSPKEGSSPRTRERYEANSDAKGLQRKLTTRPQTLIVGDGAVYEIRRFCNKTNTKVFCFPDDMVSDVSKKIRKIVAEHPTAKSLIIHTGALDVVKQQSEVLKRDYMELMNKVQSLNTEVFFSGPLPTVRRGDERFSRLRSLNRWLKDTCTAQSLNFIDNFNIFWERRHLFKADGFSLNKSGVQLLSANVFYFLRQAPAVPVKDKRQDIPKQQIRRRSSEGTESRNDNGGQRTQEEPAASSSAPQPPDNGGQRTQEEPAASSSAPQQMDYPPATTTSSSAPQQMDYTTAQHKESPLAPKAQKGELSPAPTGDSKPSPSRTPPSPQLSSSSLDSPFLDFPDRMKSLVNTGIQLTPRQNLIFSPINPPHRPPPPIPPRRKQPSTKGHRAPPPPLNHHITESFV